MKTLDAPNFMVFCQRAVLIAVLLCAFHIGADAQNIGGVVNYYRKVTAINAAKTQVSIAPVTNGFLAGDKVLIIQMKGAGITTTNSQSYGSINAVNGAGQFEYATVQSIASNTVLFTAPLCRTYIVADSVQIIRVPVYTGNVTVTSNLLATPWSTTIPGAGGVIAIEVNGTLTLNANIDASGAGFRGGFIQGTSFCTGNDFFAATNTEGLKGEGIAHWQTGQFYGRGRLANGGGGSGSANTGGGGGSNNGAGGNGGFDYNAQCYNGNVSYGGASLSLFSTSDRIFFGGGGGAPQVDNTPITPAGGNGGGIILIEAGSIAGGGNLIRSNGESASVVLGDEGGVGGGAGGSIFLACSSYTGALSLQARGGAGSSNFNSLFPADCHGPGGGGGGGVIWFPTAGTPAGVTTSLTGGAAGTINNPASSCYNTTYGAQSGSAGQVKFNLPETAPALAASSNSPVCPGSTINLAATGPATGYSYSWTGPNAFSSSLQNPAIANASGAAAGTYTVTRTQTSTGCATSASTTVTIIAVPVISVSASGGPTSCGGSNGSITISGLTNGTGYTLNPVKNGVAQATVSFTASGTTYTYAGQSAGSYTFFVSTNTGGCNSNTTTATVLADPAAPAAPVAGNSGPVCVGQTLNLTASTISGVTYAWTGPNSFSSTIQNPGIAAVTIAAGGTYSVTVTSTTTGCTSLPGNTTAVINTAPTTPVAGSNTPVCVGATLNLSATGPVTGYTYLWTGPASFTSTAQNPAIAGVTATAGGTYSVTTTQSSTGCTSATSSTVVAIITPPSISVTGSSNPTTCTGTQGTITIGGLTNGNAYMLNAVKNGAPQATVVFTATGATYTYTGLGAGSYTISVSTNPGGCASNTTPATVLGSPAALATPAPTASPNPICSGNTLNLFSNIATGVTYAWTGPNGFNSTVQDPVITGITSAGSGTYSLVVTSTTTLCSSSPGTIAVIVNQTPNITGTTSTNPTTCGGSQGTISLNGLTANTAYVRNYALNGTPQAPLTITSNAGGTVVITGLAAGSYSNFSLTSAAGCPGGVLAGPIVLSTPVPPAAPTPAAASPNPICTGTTLSLTAAGAGTGFTYVWSGPNSYSATGQNPTITNITLAAAGVYSVYRVDNATACTSAIAATPALVVNETPTTPVAASNTPVCQGGTINLTATSTAGATFSWTGPASFTASVQNPVRANALTTHSGSYTVIASNAGCPSASASTTVVVNPTPATPTASNNGPVCQGTTLSLTTPAVTGGSWTWTGPNAFTSTAQNPNIASATPAATGVYSVVLRVLNCPSLPGTTTALVNPLPVAPTTSPVAYCQFETAVPLTANGTGPLRWYTVATGGTALAAAPTPNTALPSVTTWYVSQLSAAGCQGPRASLVVTVKAKPAVPVIAQPLTTYCQYALATPLVAVGQGLLYYTTATGGTAQTFILPSTAADGTFNYYASQTVNGCESDRSQFTVIVKPKPAPPLANSPQSFCQGTGSQPLTAIGQSLLWYTVPAGGQPQAGTPLISTTNAPDSANWYVTQTVDGCQSDRAYVKAVVNYRPVGQIRGARLFVCDEDTLTLYYSGTGQSDPALSYFWSSPVVTATPYAPPAPPYGPSIIYQFHTNGPYPGSQVQLIVDNRGCQSSVLKYNVEVRELPILGLDAPGDACVGAPVTIGLNSVSLPNTDTFNWYGFAGAQIIAGQNAGPYSVSWSTAGTKYLMVQGYRRGCWSDTTADTIEIYPRPTADIEFVGATSVCIGDSIKLRAFYDPSYSYSWTPSRFFDTARNADAEMLAHIYSSSTIRLTVTGPGSCTETDTVNIEAKPCCEVFVPSGFTPNGDGKNDIFRAITKGHHPVEAFRVVNRWGNVVFDAANTNDGWDGSAYGDAQPTGTYFYYIKYKCATGEFFEKKGEVTLIR